MNLRISMIGFFLISGKVDAQVPLSTEFSFQGRLRQNDQIANGTADFRVGLWDVASGGTIGANRLGQVELLGQSVSYGLFTLPLDFGVEVFNSEERWLEFEVRSPAGVGMYEVLTPRTRITSVPYALQTRGVFVDVNGDVGIGTDNPVVPLHLFRDASDVLFVLESTGSPAFDQRIQFRDPGSDWFVGNRFSQDINGFGIGRTNFKNDFVIDSNGNIGIGTSTPSAQLHVQGPIPIGSTTALRVDGVHSLGAQLYRNDSDVLGPGLSMRKSRGTMGSELVIANGDGVGQINAMGWDGADYEEAARVRFFIDGAPGSNDMPGGISLETTPDGSNSPVSRMFIRNDGKVGINNTPTMYALEVGGDAYKTLGGPMWQTISDARVKRDIHDIDGALATLKRIRPRTFRYTDEFRKQHPTLSNHADYNVVAQEYREVFPDYVTKRSDNGLLMVNTSPLPIISVAAINELRAKMELQEGVIDLQARQIASLNDELAEIKRQLAILTQLSARSTVEEEGTIKESEP